MKRFVLLMLLVSLLIGCETSNELSNSDESVISEEVLKFVAFDEYLEVTTSIDRYQLTMSSVPGLPLDLKALKEDAEYTLDISVSAGELLSWEGGTVQPLGDSIFIDYKDSIVYWSPLEDAVIENVDLLIAVKQNDEVIAKATYIIALSDDGYVLMHLVLTDE
ncbi:MAG: hypothetical protein JEZ08_02245 [Clostridiales bacterium]|nr:hypothetical protein [Clostridiales bacterium]